MLAHICDGFPWVEFESHGMIIHTIYALIKTWPAFCPSANYQTQPRARRHGRRPRAVPLDDIRKAVQRGLPLGNDRFREQVEAALGGKVAQRRKGRPEGAPLMRRCRGRWDCRCRRGDEESRNEIDSGTFGLTLRHGKKSTANEYKWRTAS